MGNMLGMNIVLEAQRIARERKNGEEPSHDETGAVVHEICQNALSEIETILRDEIGYPRDIDKVLGIGKIFEKLSDEDDWPYASALVVT